MIKALVLRRACQKDAGLDSSTNHLLIRLTHKGLLKGVCKCRFQLAFKIAVFGK